MIRLALAAALLVAALVLPALLREATPICATAMGELLCLPGVVVPASKM